MLSKKIGWNSGKTIFYGFCSFSERTSDTDISTPVINIGTDTINKTSCITLKPPINNRVMGMAPSANAQNTRCQRAGWLPAGKLWVALDAIV